MFYFENVHSFSVLVLISFEGLLLFFLKASSKTFWERERERAKKEREREKDREQERIERKREREREEERENEKKQQQHCFTIIHRFKKLYFV